MRAAFLAAALVLGACGPRAPKGSVAVTLDPGDRGFLFDGPSRRVLFVRGTYPEKTYAGFADLETGRANLHRSPVRALVSVGSARPNSKRALFIAKPIVDENAGERPQGGILLDTIPGNAASDRALQMTRSLEPRCVLETAWSAGALVISSRVEGPAYLGRWRDGSEALDPIMNLPPGIAACTASARLPRLGVVLEARTGASFKVWDVDQKKEISTVALPEYPSIVGRAEDGRLFATWRSETSQESVLGSLDPETGRMTGLYASSDTIVSAVAVPSGVAVLLRDDREVDSKAAHLKPQKVVVVGPGRETLVSRAWTRLPSSLVGYDAATNRFILAVVDTEYAAVWAVPQDEPGFNAAAAQVERATNPFRRRIKPALGILFSAFFLLTLLIGLYNASSGSTS